LRLAVDQVLRQHSPGTAGTLVGSGAVVEAASNPVWTHHREIPHQIGGGWACYRCCCNRFLYAQPVAAMHPNRLALVGSTGRRLRHPPACKADRHKLTWVMADHCSPMVAALNGYPHNANWLPAMPPNRLQAFRLALVCLANPSTLAAAAYVSAAAAAAAAAAAPSVAAAAATPVAAAARKAAAALSALEETDVAIVPAAVQSALGAAANSSKRPVATVVPSRAQVSPTHEAATEDFEEGAPTVVVPMAGLAVATPVATPARPDLSVRHFGSSLGPAATVSPVQASVAGARPARAGPSPHASHAQVGVVQAGTAEMALWELVCTAGGSAVRGFFPRGSPPEGPSAATPSP